MLLVITPLRRVFVFPASVILLCIYIIFLLYGPFSKRFPREKPITLSPLPFPHNQVGQLFLSSPRLLYTKFVRFSGQNNASPPFAGHCLSLVLRVFLFLKLPGYRQFYPTESSRRENAAHYNNTTSPPNATCKNVLLRIRPRFR